MLVAATVTDDNAAKCAELEKQGDPLMKECKINDSDESEPTLDSAIEQLRCLWKGLKEIEIVADQVKVCEPLYPNDNELLCGIQVLFCVVEHLNEACPPDDNTA